MAGVKGMRWSRKMTASHKANISITKIVQRLEKHIFGEIEMPSSAVTAALGLLKKKLPDLAATTHSGDQENPLAVREVIERVMIDATHSDGEEIPPASNSRSASDQSVH